MKLEDAYRNTDKLIVRHRMTEIEATNRLFKFFDIEEIKGMLEDARLVRSCTDTKIMILYFKEDETYSIVTTGHFVDVVL